MKRILVATAALLSVLVSGIAFGDSHEKENRRFVPVETFACNYLDGKGPADLDAVIENWNAWMNEHDQNDYFAVTLTPFYFGPDTFDVAWLGSWPGGEAMGRGQDLWVSQGSEINAQFFEVLSCDSHSNFATTELKAPEGPTPDNVVLAFSDCTGPDSPEGWDQLMSNLDAWSAYLTSNGYHQGNWMMFPVYGGGGVKFDFKLVKGYDNHTQLGQDYQRFSDNADWEKQGELLGGLMDCDDSRVYQATVRRKAADDE
jgi:hypothetical protein